LCRFISGSVGPPTSTRAVQEALINANLGLAVLVSIVHSVAIDHSRRILGVLVYRYLGLKFVSRSWLNLDTTWAFSLILVGALSLAISLSSPH
jgi:hypothetical protein